MNISDFETLVEDSHKGQTYGTGRPYTYHLTQVLTTWYKMFGGKSGQLAEYACLGHDLLEDTEVTASQLRFKGVPEEAVIAIDLVTKKHGLAYKQYLRNICVNELAFEVKVADTYSNMTHSMKDGNFTRVKKYSNQLNLLYNYREQFWKERNNDI